MKIIERIYDASTGETNDIERNMDAQELKEYEASIERAEVQAKLLQENAIKKAAAEAKLEALGITADDLKALGL
jgi:inosine/xanthosine triphosphate pyrophosphatase family protein